jgi:hypothetical protein
MALSPPAPQAKLAHRCACPLNAQQQVSDSMHSIIDVMPVCFLTLVAMQSTEQVGDATRTKGVSFAKFFL